MSVRSRALGDTALSTQDDPAQGVTDLWMPPQVYAILRDATSDPCYGTRTGRMASASPPIASGYGIIRRRATRSTWA